MSSNILAHMEQPVKTKRFVAPKPAATSDYDAGREMYRHGKRLYECRTDAQTAGWLDAEADGADAYWRCMMAQASTEAM